jgi:hypothetical protein
VFAGNPSVRQYSDPELADFARQVPLLQGFNFSSLPRGRAAYGRSVSGMLRVFRIHSRNPEVLRFRISASGIDLHRRGNSTFARQDDFARPGLGIAFQFRGPGE